MLPLPLLLLLTSLSATLEVLIMVGVGMLLLYKKVIQESHVRVLSVLVFQLFTPCMLSYKFASSVDLNMLKTSYLAIVFAFLYILAANILARILFTERFWGTRLAGVRKIVVLVAVTFNNAGSLPYVFVSALVSTGNLFTQKQLASDQAIAFISLYLLPVQILFWSVGMATMRKKKGDNDHSEDEDADDIESSLNNTNNNEALEETAGDSTLGLRDDISQKQQLEGEQLVEVELEETIGKEEALSDHMSTDHLNQQSRMNRLKAYLKRRWNTFYQDLPPLKQVVTPPIYGSIAGIVVSLVPHAKEYLIESPPVIVASISHICEIFGGAVFPLSMILLGANLATTMQSTKEDESNDESTEPKSRIARLLKKVIKHNDPWVVLTAVVARLIVMPLIGIGLTLLFVYLGFLPKNPVLMLVLMIEASTPTAINTSILCTLNGNNGIYHMCELLLFMYLSSPITLSILSTAYLYLSCYFSPGMCNL